MSWVEGGREVLSKAEVVAALGVVGRSGGVEVSSARSAASSASARASRDCCTGGGGGGGGAAAGGGVEAVGGGGGVASGVWGGGLLQNIVFRFVFRGWVGLVVWRGNAGLG